MGTDLAGLWPHEDKQYRLQVKSELFLSFVKQTVFLIRPSKLQKDFTTSIMEITMSSKEMK